jgi:lipopolysaccharide export system ATP-binding protein
MNQLEASGLVKVYDKVPVVDHINLKITSGQIIGLLGRNGAGKTTTFLMLSGIIKPDAGQVMLDGEDIEALPSYHRAEKGLIYMPQQHSVFLKASVFQNLFLILELRYPESTAREKVDKLMDDFGLAYVKNSPAYQLSGGEKRRLEIARAMIMAPKFILLDEPFTGIDPITVIEIRKLIIKLRDSGIGIIITDHNVKDTFDITDNVYIIHNGKILSYGAPVDVVREQKTRELFLGYEFEWSHGDSLDHH